MTHIRNNVLDGVAEIARRGTRNLGSESLALPPLLALASLAAAVAARLRKLWSLSCICNETSDSQLFLCRRLNEAGGRKTVQATKQAQCKYCTALSGYRPSPTACASIVDKQS